VQSDHAFDAIVCAYTGYLWARDGWTLPEDCDVRAATEGWIWVPPEPAAPATAAVKPEIEPRRLRSG
jgi:hypothetical protein